MNRFVIGSVLSLLLPGCAPGLMVGDVCEVDSDCPGNLCQNIGTTGLVCTETCDTASPCPPPFVCGSGGVCAAACAPGAVMGGGVGREVCIDQVFVACSTLDPVTDCMRCGCQPFGGGACVVGRGCVPPAPDGTACGAGPECTSAICYTDTHVCGPARGDGESCGASSDCAASRCFVDTSTCGSPRPDGDACTVDADCENDLCLGDLTCGAPRPMGGACFLDTDCETSNCSTNGVGDAVGMCLQPLGTACTSASGTCQRCLNEDTVLGIMGRCFRLRCDGERAPTCPVFADHEYVCRESVTPGQSYCYEICQPNEDGDRTRHDCYEQLDSCIDRTMYCR